VPPKRVTLILGKGNPTFYPEPCIAVSAHICCAPLDHESGAYFDTTYQGQTIMPESINFFSQWPHCERADIKATLAKGPLVYRILAVASTLEALEKEESLVRANMHALKTALRDAAGYGWHKQKRNVLLQLRSLQLELDRILSLQARARQSLPEVQIITEKDRSHSQVFQAPAAAPDPWQKLRNLLNFGLHRKNCA
jgi:hypothetical protein